MNGETAPRGALHLQVIRSSDEREVRDRFDRLTAPSTYPGRELSLAEVAHFGLPRAGLEDHVNAWRTSNFRNLVRGARRALAARALGLSNFYGSLYLTRFTREGEAVEMGLASMRVVTTAGVGFVVDAFQNLVEPENMKFHGIGTGTVAEAVGDTALGAELTTQYNPDNTRATGTTTEGAAANVYRTVGTNTVDAAVAITEHGVFAQAATGGGVLLDRSVFAAVNMAIGDSLQTTYDLTIPAGS